MISITDGNISPNTERHTAPTKEISGPKLGTIIATTTVKTIIKKKMH